MLSSRAPPSLAGPGGRRAPSWPSPSPSSAAAATVARPPACRRRPLLRSATPTTTRTRYREQQQQAPSGGASISVAVVDAAAADGTQEQQPPAVLDPPPTRRDAAAAASDPAAAAAAQAAARRRAAAHRAAAAASNADDLDRLLAVLPGDLRAALASHPMRDRLIEVVLDLGRLPEARFRGASSQLLRSGEEGEGEGEGEGAGNDGNDGNAGNDGTPSPRQQPHQHPPGAVTREELEAAVAAVGDFGGDNRAGLPGTLHRVSAVRSRRGDVVGLTLRVGRASPGEAGMIADLLAAGMSVLFLGRPGVGKTTAIRELSRLLADGLGRRVVVVDTSNEVGGDGDVPHASIGGARRMQVPDPSAQHRVMIEAVENHMPQAVVIDEIGTEAECSACRTIAERGVALVATAHGCFLENLLKNPSLADLVGGVQAVTLGDEEAARRGTRKTVLERRGPATFPVVVEMRDRGVWVAHATERSVDALLAGKVPRVQLRTSGGGGEEEGGPTVVEAEYDRVDALVAEAVKSQLQRQQLQQQQQQQREAGAVGEDGAAAALATTTAAAIAVDDDDDGPASSSLSSVDVGAGADGPTAAAAAAAAAAGLGLGEAAGEQWARRSQVLLGASGSLDSLDAGDVETLRYLEGQAGVLRPAQSGSAFGGGVGGGAAAADGGGREAGVPKGATPAGGRRRAR